MRITRTLPALVALALAGVCTLTTACARHEADQEPTTSSAPQATKPAPPQVDRTFDDPASQAKWNADLTAAVTELHAAPAAQQYVERTNRFTISQKVLVGDPKTWDLRHERDQAMQQAPEITPNAADARRAEAEGKPYEAARAYAALHDAAGMRRCLVTLRESGEWEAVAMVAIELSDAKELERAIKTLLEADFITISRRVRDRALERGKLELVSLIERQSEHLVLDPTTISWRTLEQLAKQGNVAYLRTAACARIERYLEDYATVAASEQDGSYVRGHEAGDFVPGAVEAIVLLSRYDRPLAQKYAARLVSQAGANLLILTVEGEGVYHHPVEGTFELYQLVRTDPALRATYLARLASIMDDVLAPAVETVGVTQRRNVVAGSHSGIAKDGYSTVSEWFNPGYDRPVMLSYLGRVSALNDAPLTAFWRQQLTRIAEQLPFHAELGRMALGDKPNADAPRLTAAERWTLRRLRGSVDVRVNTPLYESDEVAGLVSAVQLAGTVDDAQARALWTDLGLETPTPTRRYSRAELGTAASVATKLLDASETQEQGLQMWVDILTSDPAMRPPESVAAHGDLAYLLIGRGYDPSPELVRRLIGSYEEDRRRAEQALYRVEQMLGGVARTAETNQRAAALEGASPHPASEAEAVALLRTVLATHREALGPHYQRLLISLSQRGVEYQALVTEEVERLRSTNQLGELQALQQRLDRSRAESQSRQTRG